MRGVQGEECPIGRELFNQTYRMGVALAQPEPEVAGPITDGRPMNQSYWLALLRHDAYAALFQSVDQYRSALIERASSPRAQPEPEGPSYRDVLALRDELDTHGYGTVDLVAFAHAVLARYARPTIRPKGTCQPNGYAYRYPAIDGTITRFNHGQEVNGCRPIYAIPYWLGQPPTACPAIEPVPEVLTDEAIEELTWRHTCEIGDLGVGIAVEDAPAFIRAALARWGRPTIKPVPVAERPWEREGWCDAEGRCWWFNHAGIPEWQLASDGPYGDFSLPHHALPVPGAEVGS
jgi:hypothetical protein